MKITDYNLEDLELVHKPSGDVLPIGLLQVEDGGKFNKVFLSELASMIECTGRSSERVLGWMLKNKNNKNEVHGTQRGIANELSISPATVTRVFKALENNDFLRIERSGLYHLNPDVMHYGGLGNKLAIVKVWRSLK